MKRLFKFIIGLIITVVLIVVIAVGALFILFSNSEDNAPIDLYNSSETINTVIGSKLNTSLEKLGDNYALDLDLNEDEMNKLVYALIRSSVNSNYSPKEGTTDEEKYIYSNISLPVDIPLVGGKKLLVKNAYVDLDNDLLEFNVTCEAFGLLKSKLTVGLKLQTTETDYVLEISSLKLGKLNLLGGFGKFVLNFCLDKGFISIDKLNEKIKNNNLPFVISLEDYTIKCSKEEFGKLLKSNVVVDGEYADVVADFVGILTDPNNNIINLNIKDNLLSLDINLEVLKVSEDKLVVDEKIKQTFNTDLFIKNKTQTFAINCLSNPNRIMTFTYEEFNQLIYNKTNGYEGFTFEETLLDNVNVKFSVEGIIIDGDGDNITITVILNISGLRTIGIVSCAVEKISKDEIHLVLDESIVIGDNLEIGSGFLNSIFSEFFNDLEMLTYNEEGKYFVVTTDVFNSFVSEASATSTLSVSEIDFSTIGLEISVAFANTEMETKFNAVTDHLKDVLDSDFVDTARFNTEDPEQEAAVNAVIESLGLIQDTLSGTEPDLDEILTSGLISDISNLSPENQTELLNQIQGEFTDDDLTNLTDLYSLIFGN